MPSTSASPGSAAAPARCCARPTAGAPGRTSPARQRGLLFRDVEAASAQRASVLSIGEGDASRIYTTFDGGRTLEHRVRQRRPARVLRLHGVLRRRPPRAGDERPGRRQVPVRRHRRLGPQLARAADDGMPDAVAGEFGFAASGTCLVTSGGRDAWFASGGGASRVFHSRDGGMYLDRRRHADPRRAAGGVFSLAFRNPREGVIVGGDFTAPDNGVDASGLTRDGGATWQPRRRPRRLPLRRRLGRRSRTDADRGRPDRLGLQLRRRPHLDALRQGAYDAVDCVPSPAGRAARRARSPCSTAQRSRPASGPRRARPARASGRRPRRRSPRASGPRRPLGLEPEIDEHDGVVHMRGELLGATAGRDVLGAVQRRASLGGREAQEVLRDERDRAARALLPRRVGGGLHARSGARRASRRDGTRNGRPGSARAPPREPARQALSRT